MSLRVNTRNIKGAVFSDLQNGKSNLRSASSILKKINVPDEFEEGNLSTIVNNLDWLVSKAQKTSDVLNGKADAFELSEMENVGAAEYLSTKDKIDLYCKENGYIVGEDGKIRDAKGNIVNTTVFLARI